MKVIFTNGKVSDVKCRGRDLAPSVIDSLSALPENDSFHRLFMRSSTARYGRLPRARPPYNGGGCTGVSRKKIAATSFKTRCFAILDEVHAKRVTVLITEVRQVGGEARPSERRTEARSTISLRARARSRDDIVGPTVSTEDMGWSGCDFRGSVANCSADGSLSIARPVHQSPLTNHQSRRFPK